MHGRGAICILEYGAGAVDRVAQHNDGHTVRTRQWRAREVGRDGADAGVRRKECPDPVCVDDIVGVRAFERCPRVAEAFGQQMIDARAGVFKNMVMDQDGRRHGIECCIASVRMQSRPAGQANQVKRKSKSCSETIVLS
jgi:hypothetical protein